MIIRSYGRDNDIGSAPVAQPESILTRVHSLVTHKVSALQLYRFAGCKERLLLTFGIICAAGIGTSLPLMCVVVGNAINGFSPTNTMDEVLDEVSAQSMWMVYIGVSAFVLSIISESSWIALGERLGIRVRYLYLNALMRKEVAWFDTNHPQELPGKISLLVSNYQSGIGEKAGKVIVSISMFVAGITIAFVYGWQLALVLMAIYPLTLLAARQAGIATSAGAETVRKGYAQCGGYAEEALSAIKTVYAFCAQQFEKQRYLSELATAEKTTIRSSIYLGASVGLINLAIAFTQGLGYFIGSFFIEYEVHNSKYDQPYTCASVLTVFFAGLFSMFSLGMIAPQLKCIQDAQIAASEIYEVIGMEPAVAMKDSAVQPTQGLQIPADKFRGRIEFKNVTFSYPTRPKVKALDNFSAVFEPGKMTGLCGETGSGKSTVVQLIEGFYRPQSGCIEIDGIDLNKLDLQWWRRMLGYVGQEPVLFNTSIELNISYGSAEASHEEVARAASQANALEFIERLEEGFNTKVGTGGGQLSGGQKQRVAIARALVRSPKILLLDEATSALDNTSEHRIQEAIFALQKAGHMTCIVVAHRLSTIHSADCILVLNGGTVAEHGTDHELRSHQGIYAHLCQLQECNPINAAPTEGFAKAPEIEELVLPSTNPTGTRASSATLISVASSGRDSVSGEDRGLLERYRKQIWAENWKHKYHMIFAILLSIMAGYNMPVSGTLFGMVSIDLLDPNKATMRHKVNLDFVGFVVIGFVTFFISFGMFWLFGYVAAKVTYRLREKLFGHILTMDVNWFEQPSNHSSNLCGILAEGTENINGVVRIVACSLIQACSALVIALCIGFAYSWRMAIVVLGCVPVMALIGFIQTKFQMSYARQSQQLYLPSAELLTEAVRNFRTVLSFSCEERTGQMYWLALQPPLMKGQVAAVVSGLLCGFASFLPFIIYSQLFYLAALFLVKYEDDPRNTFVAVYALLFAALALGQVQNYAPDMGKAYASLFSVYGIVDQTPKITSPERPVETEVTGRIQFQNVCFKYPSRNDYVLNNLSMTIEPGQRVTLVGASGSGKSTVIQLLERFYDADSGRILIDGVDIREYGLSHLRKSLGYVPQEPYLFDASIADNVKYGKQDTTETELRDACRSASALDFIEREAGSEEGSNSNRPITVSPRPSTGGLQNPSAFQSLRFPMTRGMERRVGTKGSLLSGGQKQRLAIARAIVRNPRVLLFDEATSALDSETEAAVQASLAERLQGRTVVSVAHRLSTLGENDRIFVLENGGIVETGTKAELMKNKGSFYKLYTP